MRESTRHSPPLLLSVDRCARPTSPVRLTILRANPFESLSAREYEVLRLLATGATNAQMARTLTLSEGTIRNVVAHVTCKLGVADRTQAALLGCRAGLG